MSRDHIYNLNLNLLLALHALLEEQSVTRAAARFGVTQSAMSRSLAQLRAQLDDPLLIRTRHGMRPTDHALALREPLRRLVADATAIMARQVEFDPATARRTFFVGTADYTQVTLLPPLLTALAARAPGISVSLRREHRHARDQMEDGRLDLAISPGYVHDHPSLRTRRLFEDTFVCVMRPDHPAAHAPLDLDAYCAQRHALAAPLEEPGSPVDDLLTRLGRTRQLVLTTPSFLTVGHAIAHSDLIATLPTRLAAHLTDALGLTTRPTPPELGLTTFSIALFWHERQHHDPAHQWFRDLIHEVIA